MPFKHLVLLAMLLFPAPLVNAQEQDTPADNEAVILSPYEYDHKIIAVLPFRSRLPKYPAGSAAEMERFKAFEDTLGQQAQIAFYNALTSEQHTLTVKVQDWRITDSLLRRAGIDFRKANFLDKQLLAGILKVDAVLAGEMQSANVQSDIPSDVIAFGVLATAIRMLGIMRSMSVLLFDGKTGDLIWRFEKVLGGNKLFRQDKQLEARLYKLFFKRFPYAG